MRADKFPEGDREILKSKEDIHIGREPALPITGTVWIDTDEKQTWVWGALRPDDADDWFDAATRRYRVGQMQFPGVGESGKVTTLTLTANCPTDRAKDVMDDLEFQIRDKCFVQQLLLVRPPTHRMGVGDPNREDTVSIITTAKVRRLPDTIDWYKSPKYG